MNTNDIGESFIDSKKTKSSFEKAVSFVTASDKPMIKQMEVLSYMLLPQLEDFMDEGGEDVIKGLAAETHDILSNLDSGDFEELFETMTVPDGKPISSALLDIFTNTEYAVHLKMVNNQKHALAILPEDQQIAMVEAVSAVGPAALMQFTLALKGLNHLSPAERVLKERTRIENGSVEDLTLTRLKEANGFPENLFQEGYKEIVSKITPESLERAVNEFTARVSKDDFIKLGVGGAAFAKDFLKSSMQGNPYKFDDPSNAVAFGETLGHVLQSIEDSAIEAGITLDDPNSYIAGYQAAMAQARGFDAATPSGP